MSAIPIFFDLTSLTIAQGTTYQRLRQICNSDCEYPSLGGYTMDVSHTPRKIKYRSSNQIPPETFVMISSVSALSLCVDRAVDRHHWPAEDCCCNSVSWALSMLCMKYVPVVSSTVGRYSCSGKLPIRLCVRRVWNRRR